jgi:hypothetical protein
LFLKTGKGKIMKSKKYKLSAIVFYSVIIALALVLPNMAFALQSGDFTYEVSDGTVTITGYTCAAGDAAIPATIDGKPVVGIGSNAFYECYGLTSVRFPYSVKSIGERAFYGCAALTKAVFFGNAPLMGADVFQGCSSNFTVCFTNRSTGFTFPTWCPTYDQCYQAEMCVLMDSPCPCVKIYGENSDETELLRKYRDNVLSKTPEGQEIIKTYYQFSPTLNKLLEQRPFLKNRAKAIIDSMLPGIKKKVDESQSQNQ